VKIYIATYSVTIGYGQNREKHFRMMNFDSESKMNYFLASLRQDPKFDDIETHTIIRKDFKVHDEV
jgi:hypothetical protein